MAKKIQKIKKKMGRPPLKNSSTSRHSDWVSEKRLPTPKPDPEEDVSDILGSEDEDPVFEAELKKAGKNHPMIRYPPPKKDRTFRRKWRDFIGAICKRDNFNTSYLFQLEILCDLYVEYEQLRKFLRINGMTYEAFGRQGKMIKPFPQVAQQNRVMGEIRSYSKMLGLMLVKDKNGDGEEQGDWG